MAELTGKGVTGRVSVDDAFVTITRKGFLAKANHGFTAGEKRIALGSITAVQFKKPGLSNGYIQFTVGGGNEGTRGLMQGAKDENTVLFAGNHRGEFEAIRDHIERVIAARHNPASSTLPPPPAPPAISLGDQVRELAQLRDEGLITDAEYEAQKAKLLS